MAEAKRYLAQALLYALFFLPIVYFTQNPTYHNLDDDRAELKLAIRHAGARIGACEPLTTAPSGMGAGKGTLPANMEAALKCPRERSPLQIELRLDGETLYHAAVPASGLYSDGVSSMYRRFTIEAGRHYLQLLMNDDSAHEGYNLRLEQDVDLRPGQVMVATFKGGLRLE